MNDEKYKLNDRVYFCLGEDKPFGWATVCGVQGFIIIIKPEEQIPSYPYTHIYVVDSQITAPPSENPSPSNTIIEGA
jgi:hypothetical protein